MIRDHTGSSKLAAASRLGLAAALFVGLAACGDYGHPSAGQSPTSTSVAATGTVTPSATPEPEPRTFTLVATGDVLLHERLWNQASDDGNGTMDFAPQLANIRPVVEGADLAICHLETPLAPEEGPYEGYPSFSSPPQIVSALVGTGYDACTTASNHTFDKGASGIDRSLEHLDKSGIAHAGSARSPDEADETTLIKVDTPAGPVTVGLLSYTYGFNGIPYPDGHTWRSNEIDEAQILDDAATAKTRGAEFVIAALHWGDEYVHEPNAQQSELAPTLIESSDIDLLLGHHAHVVQPIENVAGEWIVYGMGNLMANHAEPETPKAEGLLTKFTFTEDRQTGTFAAAEAKYLPLLQTHAFPIEVLDVPAALDSGDTGTASTSRLETALDRTAEIVQSRGAGKHGLTPLSP